MASRTATLVPLERITRSIAPSRWASTSCAPLLALDFKTQRQFEEVYEAIRALMSAPAPKRRGIGFTADLDEKT